MYDKYYGIIGEIIDFCNGKAYLSNVSVNTNIGK